MGRGWVGRRSRAHFISVQLKGVRRSFLAFLAFVLVWSLLGVSFPLQARAEDQANIDGTVRVAGHADTSFESSDGDQPVDGNPTQSPSGDDPAGSADQESESGAPSTPQVEPGSGTKDTQSSEPAKNSRQQNTAQNGPTGTESDSKGPPEGDEQGLELRSAASNRPQDNPVNDQAVGNRLPTLTSSWSPTGSVQSGDTRTVTIKYGGGATNANNVRAWHQIVVDADHETEYKVTCTRPNVSSSRCPAELNSSLASFFDTWHTIEGEAGQPYNTFWGFITVALWSEVAFTIDMKTTLKNTGGDCSSQNTAAVNSYARVSQTGFSVPGDVAGSSLLVGSVVESGGCPPGVVEVTNELISPVNTLTDMPINVLSEDPIEYKATWENLTNNPVRLPIYYEFSLPGEGNTAEATWTCTSTNGGAGCPDFDAGEEGEGDPPDEPGGEGTLKRLFGSDPEDESTFVTLESGEKLEYQIVVTPKLVSCSPEGYFMGQSFAQRGSVAGELANVRTSAPSAQTEIGCANWVVDETFGGESVSASEWLRIDSDSPSTGGPACLTKATTPPELPGELGKCDDSTGSPTPDFSPGTSGLPDGYLQLTPDVGYSVGAVAYRRPVASKNGLVVEFTQYQFGVDSTGADGIGFFLANGGDSLTKVGPEGGPLGYAYDDKDNPGLPNGYLGVGFDVFGNFAASSSKAAAGCAGAGGTGVANSVTLRGPGNGTSGYCAVGQTQSLSDLAMVNGASQANYTLRAVRSGEGDAAFQQVLVSSKRRTRVIVYPQQEGATGPKVRVQMDFGNGFVDVAVRTMEEPIPTTIRFGFLGSTGGSKDAHLLSDVRVGTVMTPPELELMKQVDLAQSPGPSYDVGETIHYKFLINNNGLEDAFDVTLQDPKIPGVVCDGDDVLEPQEQTACTGSYVVTENDQNELRLRNQATVTASSMPDYPPNASAAAWVDVPVNPTARDDAQAIGPGQTASFSICGDGSRPGLVVPDNPDKISISEVSQTGGGQWTFDSETGQVTYAAGNNQGTATLKYKATSKVDVNGVAGVAEGTLTVTVSNAPTPSCSDAQRQNSSQWWYFGDKAGLEFQVSGATATGSGAPESQLDSGNANTFTVSDRWGRLQFIVDPGRGRIITKSGAVMKHGGSGASKDTEIDLPVGVGASPATVFPLEQGSGKYVVVTSDATSTHKGQLTYRVLDMALNDGEGGLDGAESVSLGGTEAGPALTSVPGKNGTDYWVLNPLRGSANVAAYPFSRSTPGFGQVTISGGRTASGVGDGSVGYDDIRFSYDLALVATVSSNNAQSTTRRTQLSLLEFNAASGTLTNLVSKAFGENNSLGYSAEFAPASGWLYFSSIPQNGSNYKLERSAPNPGALLATNRLGGREDVATAQTGGTIRLGSDKRLYWANSSQGNVRYLPDPNGSGTALTQLPLAPETSSGWALSNTLTDCAIAPRGFEVKMVDSTGGLIGGGAFALYSADPGSGGNAPEPVAPGFTQEEPSGTFSITGLEPGTYWLTQTKAPPTYNLLAQPVRLTVAFDGSVAYAPTAPTPQVKFSNSGHGDYTFEVQGTRAVTLPFLGGIRPWLTLAAALGLLGLVAYAVRRRYQVAQ